MADLNFDGTHKPGEHTTIAPTPPKIIVPERKITTVAEAAKWHGTRGGAVVASNPVLLTDLVARWSLTANANQTLSSAGVIASGALDLTAQNSPTFNADGMNCVYNSNPANGKFAKKASVAALQFASDQWMIAAEVVFDDFNQYYNIVTKSDNTANEYFLTLDSTGSGFVSITVYNNGVTYAFAISTTEAVIGQRAFVCAWSDGVNIYIQLNNATPISAAWTNSIQVTSTQFSAGGSAGANNVLNGKLRHLTIWKGASAIKNSAARTWLANMSGGVSLGRTDAEVAAYTG